MYNFSRTIPFLSPRQKEGLMKKTSKCLILVLTPLICQLLLWSQGYAETKRFQWSTRVSLAEQFDDNINLEKDNRDHDWITSISPGLTLAILTEKTDIKLDYDLSFVYYARDDSNNDVRHSLILSGLKDIPIGEHLTLDLDESLQISEDPIEISEGITSVRHTRNRYYRNTAGGRINYLFGKESLLYAGFNHLLLENEDPSVEDSQTYRPIAGITYWFNVRHGLSLDLSYSRGEFDLSEDYEKHLAIATYTYRFSPRTQTSLSYTYDAFDYDGEGLVTREDYVVHSSSLGFTHQFTEKVSASISGGYWVRDLEQSNDSDGFNGTASFIQRLERGSLTLSGSGGYRQQFVEAENLGFSKFYRTTAAFNYGLLEQLTATLSGFYSKDEFQETAVDRQDETWGGSAVLNCVLFRWLSASLSYDYRQRDSTISENDYTDNRLTLRFVAFYLSKPEPF